MSNEQLREALQRIQYKAVSLADAQVIALEALASQTTSPSAAPAPASSQDEPFGYFRAEPFGWADCAATDEGAIALYERPAAPAVPQGWKLVPVEPTQEMMDAMPSMPAIGAPGDMDLKNKGWSLKAIQNRHRWIAALAATPATPSQEPAVNLSCKSTQARLAAQWGYVPAPSQPVQGMPDVATWLWFRFVDYCRKQSMTPRHQKGLFAIVHDLRTMLASTTPPVHAAAQEPVTLTDRQFDLICQAIDKADTIMMEGDYMLDSDDCIAVVRVMQALFSIAALREKEGK